LSANWKIFAFFLILGVVIVFASYSILKDAERTAVVQFVDRQQLIEKQTLEGVETVLKSIFGDARYLASFPDVVNMDKQTMRQHFWAVYKSRSDILASITRMDSLGRIVVTVPYEDYEGTDISHQPHIKKILLSRKPVIGGPIRVVQGFDAIIYHHPVFLRDSVFNGTVAVLVSFDSLANQFFGPLFGNEAQIVWLADESGRVLIHSQKPSGVLLDSIYAGAKDVSLKRFLNSLSTSRNEGFVVYSRNNLRRILVCRAINVGFERWIMGIDSDYALATAPIAPLRWKILGITVLFLLIAFFVARLMLANAQKKIRIEQQSQILKFETENRRKLGKIYRVSQSLIYPDSDSGSIFEEILKVVSEIFDTNMVLSWIYSEREQTWVPGPYVIKDYRIQDEFRKCGIDPAHIELGDKIGEHSPDEISSYVMLDIKSLKETNKSISAAMYSVQSVCKYSHITFVVLKLREKKFAVIAIPSEPTRRMSTELLETFSLSFSQALYIRSMIAELYKSSKIYRDILENIDKAVFLVDTNMTILSVSPVFYKLFDVSGEAVGKNLFEVVPFLKDIGREVIYSEVIKNKTSVETEEIRIIDENRKVITRTKIIPVIEENEKVTRILTIVEDITDFRLLEEQLKRTAEELARKNRQLAKLAITDELTQLRNYRYFTENLPKVINQHYSEGKPLALLAMDLDDFKRYNDNYGHQAGDKLLAEIAEIVRGFLRTGDFAARYGGDEFVLVLSDCDIDEAVDTAERLCARIASTPLPDNFGQRTEHITASIGVAVMKDEFIDAEELLRRADTALYVSKARGKGQVTLYEVEIDERKD